MCGCNPGRRVNTDHCPRLLLPREPKCCWSKGRCCVVAEPRGQRMCALTRAPVSRDAELTEIRYNEFTGSPNEIRSHAQRSLRVKTPFIDAQQLPLQKAESGHKDGTASPWPWPEVYFTTSSSLCFCHTGCVTVTLGGREDELTHCYSAPLWGTSTWLSRSPRRCAGGLWSASTQCTWWSVGLVRILPLYAPRPCIDLKHTQGRR